MKHSKLLMPAFFALTVVCILIFVWTIHGWFSVFQFTDISSNPLKRVSLLAVSENYLKQNQIDSDSIIVGVGRDKEKTQPAPVDWFIEELKSEDFARLYYEAVVENVPDFSKKDSLANVMLLGSKLESSEEFGRRYIKYISELNSAPWEALNALEAWMEKVPHEDPQIKSLAMSVVWSLDLPDDSKQGYFRNRLIELPYYQNEQNVKTISPAIADSLIYLRQTSANSEEVLESVKILISKYPDDDELKEAVQIRLYTYFPELMGTL